MAAAHAVARASSCEPRKQVHAEREGRLVDAIRGTAAAAAAAATDESAEFVTTGQFVRRLFTHAPYGNGDFVDVGSGASTANVVAYVDVMCPGLFAGVHAVDLTHDDAVVREVRGLQTRVGRATAESAITWWTANDPWAPDTVVSAFSGRQLQIVSTADLFARASFVFCADLLFDRAAVDAYRRALVRSLVDYREVVYVTCVDPVGMPPDAPDGEWVCSGACDPARLGGDAPMRSADAYLNQYALRCAKFVARGNGADTTRSADTPFYAVVLRGPHVVVDVPLLRRTRPDDTDLIRAAEDAVGTDLGVAFAAMPDTHVRSMCDVGEMTAESCTRLVHEMCYCADAEARLDDDSRVVDIASGFGKMVVAFALCAPFIRGVTGIESDPARSAAAAAAVDKLRARGSAWDSRMSKVSFMCTSISGIGSSAVDYSGYSHVVMIGALAYTVTREIFACLARSSNAFRVLVCDRGRSDLAKMGWPFDRVPLVVVSKLREIETTRKKGRFVTLRVYRCASADDSD